MSDLAQAAIELAELGYRVFPCAHDANPTPLTRHGFKDATTDLGQIERWWHLHPAACIGLATEGLLVVDVDAPPNPWLTNEPELALDLVVAPTSTTPSGGRHHIFRRPANKSWSCTVGQLAPRVDTRTDGGYIVVPPSVRPDGAYRWLDGSNLDVGPERLPEPPAWLVERLDALASRSHRMPTVATSPVESNKIPSGLRNSTLAKLAGHMRQVGMSLAELRAALQQINADRCSPPLDEAEVDRIAASIAKYEPNGISVALVEQHYEQMFAPAVQEDAFNETPIPTDPGQIPSELLRIPGFVSEVMDQCLETAPYPNVALAFCGALSLQAVLAGRKVRDSADNRTNIYLLALAYASMGKDWPRKLNANILHRAGLVSLLGERFASGEGIQDQLQRNPCMLFQTDEFDGLLQSINKSKDARYENIMSMLLTMFSSSNTIYPMRCKAGKEDPGVIDQPCLVVYGTAITTHYYNALSERMLTNGLFARTLVVESGPRSAGREPGIIEASDRIIQTARWWADLKPGTGNLNSFHPEPLIVPAGVEARDLYAQSRQLSETEYSGCESRCDPVGTTVWGRFPEQVRKLALIFAISGNPRDPRIDATAVRWAMDFMLHQTRRMLFMAGSHVAENPFHAECLKVTRKLSEAPNQELSHSVLLKRMKLDAKVFKDLISTLEQQGDLVAVSKTTAGRPQRTYRLRSESRLGTKLSGESSE